MFPNYSMYSKHIWKELKLFLEYKELLIPPTPFLYAASSLFAFI